MATSAPADQSARSAPAAPVAPAAKPDEKAAEGCPKCGSLDSWGTASWCPKCGYYPRLGTCAGSNGAESSATDGEVKPGPTSYLEALQRLPSWTYVLAAGIFGVFFISVAVRVVTPDDSFARSAWATLQLLIGLGTFLGAHIYAFARATMKGAAHDYWDIIIHPIEVWRPTFRELPATSKRVWAGMWGFTAYLCAILVIGGIDYDVLTRDWGFKERPKQNLMKKITAKMIENAKDGADNLEDAVKDFAGEEEAKKKAEEKKKDSELEMLSAECLVVGFNVDKESGQVSELILASVVDDKLVYVGSVTEGISPEMQKDLTARLPSLQQDKPFLKAPHSATWVKPIITCRTSFKSWSENKRMQQPVLKELLADVDAR